MRKELDEQGKIKIIPKNVYLIKNVNYTEYKNIYEWECIAESETSYKFSDKLLDRVFWIEKDNFYSSAFGPRGYHVFECIYDHKDEQARVLKMLVQK